MSIKISEDNFDRKLKNACQIVERYARSIGRDCEIIFHDKGVQIAPLSWGGDVQGSDLYKALKTARHES